MGSPTRPKSRGRARLRKRSFGVPLLDDPRPPFADLPPFPPPKRVLARRDRDWRDDERTIDALAKQFQVERAPTGREEIQVERHWPIPARKRTPTVVDWRRRAWFYRQVLIALGLETVAGFDRVPNKTKQPKWNAADMHVLDLLVSQERARIKRQTGKECTEESALHQLENAGALPGGMKFDAVKKLLQRWRARET